jgi:hypothetical protein
MNSNGYYFEDQDLYFINKKSIQFDRIENSQTFAFAKLTG